MDIVTIYEILYIFRFKVPIKAIIVYRSQLARKRERHVNFLKNTDISESKGHCINLKKVVMIFLFRLLPLILATDLDVKNKKFQRRLSCCLRYNIQREQLLNTNGYNNILLPITFYIIYYKALVENTSCF